MIASIRNMSMASYLMVGMLVGCCGCHRREESSSNNPEMNLPTPQVQPGPPAEPTVPGSCRGSRDLYAAPQYWLIDRFDVAIRIERVVGERGILVLYSSWCPRVRSHIKRDVNDLQSAFPEYRTVGVFADDEVGQLIDAGRMSAQDREHYPLGVVEPQYLDTDLFERYRMPRAQWEALGARAGGQCAACFESGTRVRCPRLRLPSYDEFDPITRTRTINVLRECGQERS